MRKCRLALCALMVVGSSLWAATITIVPTGTTSAAVTEQDAPYLLVVAYTQNGGNGKAWLTANATADLTITGFPAATITAIHVYMRSNKSSGSGQMDLRLSDRSLLTYSGPFADWEDTGYSTTFLPFGVSGTWQVAPEDILQLHFEATANSLYWQQVVIEYDPMPLTIGCAELRWLEDGQLLTEQLCEQTAGEGILLPGIDETHRVVVYEGVSYRFIAWTNQITDNALTMPFAALPGQRFWLTSPSTTLYALYGSQTDTLLETTNRLQDGEYVLGLKSDQGTLVMPAGRVDKGTVPIHVETMSRTSNGIVAWQTSAVADNLRYTLTVTNDSVTLYHRSTNSYLGYNNSGTLSATQRPWAWQALARGTIVLYHSSTKSITPRSLLIKEIYNDDKDENNVTVVIGEGAAQWTEETEYLCLFPVSDLPASASQKRYTTFPLLTPLRETQSAEPMPVKVWQDGRLWIRCGQRLYNLMGMPL